MMRFKDRRAQESFDTAIRIPPSAFRHYVDISLALGLLLSSSRSPCRHMTRIKEVNSNNQIITKMD